MVEFNEFNTILEKVKIIDFSSSLHHSQLDRFSIYEAIPEYLPPEILNLVDEHSHVMEIVTGSNNAKLLNKSDELIRNTNPWSTDVWSLGVMVLEIVNGFPIWLSTDTKLRLSTGNFVFGHGLFNVPKCGKKKKSNRNIHTI